MVSPTGDWWFVSIRRMTAIDMLFFSGATRITNVVSTAQVMCWLWMHHQAWHTVAQDCYLFVVVASSNLINQTRAVRLKHSQDAKMFSRGRLGLYILCDGEMDLAGNLLFVLDDS
jgi:hypothetical protein